MLGPWLPRAGPRPRPPLLLQRLLWPDRRTSRTRPCPGRRWAGSPRCPPWMTHPLARSWETRCRVPSCLTPRSWMPLLAPPLLRWRRAARRRPTASCQVHPDPAGRLRQRASRVVVRGVGGRRGRRRCRLASSLGRQPQLRGVRARVRRRWAMARLCGRGPPGSCRSRSAPTGVRKWRSSGVNVGSSRGGSRRRRAVATPPGLGARRLLVTTPRRSGLPRRGGHAVLSVRPRKRARLPRKRLVRPRSGRRTRAPSATGSGRW